MNEQEVREKIRSAPSYPKLRAAVRRFYTRLYGKESGYLAECLASYLVVRREWARWVQVTCGNL